MMPKLFSVLAKAHSAYTQHKQNHFSFWHKNASKNHLWAVKKDKISKNYLYKVQRFFSTSHFDSVPEIMCTKIQREGPFKTEVPPPPLGRRWGQSAGKLPSLPVDTLSKEIRLLILEGEPAQRGAALQVSAAPRSLYSHFINCLGGKYSD